MKNIITAETTITVREAPVNENGEVLLIPLNKLKKSPKNARKTAHSHAHIEALAASIGAKGMLQNLVVEPDTNAKGEPTGSYLVTIGEGRRLAQLLRVKRKQIKKTEPIRCVLDTENDAAEISLDENVTREAMHPADQFERFRELAENRGWGAEEIAARFGVTAHVVKQRMRLGAISPKLMQVYREGGLSLDQLMAFAITDDHDRQVHVFENLSYNRDPSYIRRDLTRMNVAASDRRARFVGVEAYTEAGGSVIRDLFTEDQGGYFEDAALLDRLVAEKLESIAAKVQEAEGWKWTSVQIDFPHAHGMRRTYPHAVALSEEDEAAYAVAQDDYVRLSSEYEGYDELPDHADQQFGELETLIERLEAKRHAYDAKDTMRGGVFVILNHDGTARIERGFIRPEDEAAELSEDGEAVIDGVRVNGDGEIIEDEDADESEESDTSMEAEDAVDDTKPLSDLLIRDLSAHYTLGLRLIVGEQPEMALVAVVHTLAAQTFYRGCGEAHCLEIRPTSAYLATYADGIEDTAAAKMLADRHAEWAVDMPRDIADLWSFVAGLDHASLMALLAHCASLTINAVRLPWEQTKRRANDTAAKLASAVMLDMSTHWTPTVGAYLGRITKAHILAAVKEAHGDGVADRLRGMKKTEMAQAAEHLLAGTGWLPSLLRTERPEWSHANEELIEPEHDAYMQAAE